MFGSEKLEQKGQEKRDQAGGYGDDNSGSGGYGSRNDNY